MKLVYIFAIVAICLLVVGTFLMLPEYHFPEMVSGWRDPTYGRHVPIAMQWAPVPRVQQWSELEYEVEAVAKKLGVEVGEKLDGTMRHTARFLGKEETDWKIDPLTRRRLENELRKAAKKLGFTRMEMVDVPSAGFWGRYLGYDDVVAYFYF